MLLFFLLILYNKKINLFNFKYEANFDILCYFLLNDCFFNFENLNFYFKDNLYCLFFFYLKVELSP